MAAVSHVLLVWGTFRLGAAIAQGVSAQSLPNTVVTPNFDDITDEDAKTRMAFLVCTPG